MNPKHSDVFLWAALGFFGLYAAFAARKELLAVREAARITQEETAPEMISQQTEDAISLETIAVLAQSPNLDIRQASIRILIERVTRLEVYHLLLHNIAGTNIERRDQALACLRYLSISATDDVVGNEKTFKALVKFLRSFLKETRTRKHHPATDWKERTQPERDALFVLRYTIGTHMQEALRAGLVTKWLANYPFGGAGATERQKKIVVRRLKADQTDDEAMAFILNMLDCKPAGRRQLWAAGLIGDIDIEIAGDIEDLSSIFQPGPRETDDEDEQARRRRRREAVVISEAGHPISNDDIYHARDYAT